MISGPGFRIGPAALVEIAGKDRDSFLQGQCTNDVLRLAPGAVARAATLSPKGKLLADFRIARLDPIRILTAPGRAAALASHLRKYAVFQDVRIENVESELFLIELYGSGPLPAPAPGRLVDSSFAGHPVQVWPPFFETSASWLVSRQAAPAVEAELSSSRARVSPEDAECLRIEAGRPEYGKDMDDSNLPDEIGMDDAISTTKGCYVGQEIVARLRTYGRVNRRLVGWAFSPSWLPVPGTRLGRPGEPDRELGVVTSSADSPRLGPIGLGFTHRDVGEGEGLCPAGDASRIATVAPVRRTV
ncbi:MAG: YgfZ/GcvT domain-containing protein [Thermoanaerobaculia bacterium]